MAVDTDTRPTTGRRARFRLRDMHTTAVGLVNRAANEETFLVVKSMSTQKDAPGGEDAGQGGLRLPAAAKQSLTDGLADALEKLATIAQQVQGCQVDEAAECPPELASQIDEIADDLDELAEEFSPSAKPEEMEEKSKKRKDNAVAKAKAKAFPGAAPPFTSRDKDPAAPADVDKGGAPFSGAPPEVGKDAPGEGGGSFTASPQNGPGDADNPALTGIAKSGRKMARERLAALQSGHASHAEGMDLVEKGLACMQKGHDGIAQVLKEVGDPAFGQPPGAAPKGPPPSGKPAPAEPEVAPRAAMPDVSGMAKAAVDAALAGPVAELRAELTKVSKSLSDAQSLDALRSLTGRPRSSPNEAPPPSGAASKKREPWPADISADLKKKRAGK